ncbi:MAG: 2-amino-4-hydroxy-6-hydroxymethyldihydropteridine diphosphokinase [Bacteroidota bacterium]|nr:2-amino-4-hydroxy-6-hydroxymethyldihydropteridine diphosphokinase [Bacteroidota bacterium]
MSTKEYGTNKKLEIENIFLGLGSNQGDRELNLKNSIKLLNSRVGKVLNTSAIYESEPWGVKNQNYFLNQVVEIETHIDPNDLLNICKNIEYYMGRKPEIRWGKRVIDIDILYYQSKIINQEKLIIPHKLMHERNFVMIPLNDLNENHLHPILKITNKEILNKCIDSCNVKYYGN